jgi:hypothetical protein
LDPQDVQNEIPLFSVLFSLPPGPAGKTRGARPTPNR